MIKLVLLLLVNSALTRRLEPFTTFGRDLSKYLRNSAIVIFYCNEAGNHFVLSLSQVRTLSCLKSSCKL